MGYFLSDVAEKKEFKQTALDVFHVLFVCFCNLVYISDIACGLEFGLFHFQENWECHFLNLCIFDSLFSWSQRSVYKVCVLEMP